MAINRSYENDGSGRDTYINHAGAYWMNPLPKARFLQSLSAPNGVQPVTFHDSFGCEPKPGRELYGRSRFGLDPLVLPKQDLALPKQDFSLPKKNLAHPKLDGGLPRQDVSLPRLERVFARTDRTADGVEANFGGTKGPWEAPKGANLTLVRIAPSYESTCHHGLRTGRFYTDDQAPPHGNKLPEKGLRWGRSKYF
ncbi:unnamed protein product [Phytomonas sp. Hart1]|nr:unnamed protein product [Phytomonas sp. Hart1]|eukprot:CCW68693.1 unnamed protein product [Phytomonas sp. isolate Hart1]